MSIVNRVDVIGHVCHDLLANGAHILGGPASYCSIMTSRFCDNVQLYTSHSDDFLFDQIFEDHSIGKYVSKSRHTTVFENIYQDEGRIQYMHSRADDLEVNEIRSDVYPDIMMLCPIANEVLIEENIKISGEILVAAPLQGWLRTFDEDGRVLPSRPEPNNLSRLDIGILSDDDMEGLPSLLDQLVAQIPLLVVTSGHDGADIYHEGRVITLPAFPSDVVDLTGAGDVFSASFICAYFESRDIIRSVAFAHSAASLSIEAQGLSGLPSLDQILTRQQHYMKHYL